MRRETYKVVNVVGLTIKCRGSRDVAAAISRYRNECLCVHDRVVMNEEIKNNGFMTNAKSLTGKGGGSRSVLLPYGLTVAAGHFVSP